jgi:hypothetical protein
MSGEPEEIDPSVAFTVADAERAHDEWGANCGPGALAAIMGRTLDEVRPHMDGFEGKGYTNPTMMFDALRSIGAKWKSRTVGSECAVVGWPRYGLARIQWEGPWTGTGVPIRARYHYTHLVGSWIGRHGVGVFDINCINNGSGWVSFAEWADVVVPFILASYRRASGEWHITHAIEVDRPTPVHGSGG